MPTQYSGSPKMCSTDRYDDMATGEVPPRLEYGPQGTVSDPQPTAKGRPTVQQADGTENLRANASAKQAGNPSVSMGAKDSWPGGVTSYSDDEV